MGKQNHGITEKHQPDKPWMLAVLATIALKDDIFEKNYLPPQKVKPQKMNKPINLPATFIKGLPIPKSKSKINRTMLAVDSRPTSGCRD